MSESRERGFVYIMILEQKRMKMVSACRMELLRNPVETERMANQRNLQTAV